MTAFVRPISAAAPQAVGQPVPRPPTSSSPAATFMEYVLPRADALAELGVEHVEMPATPERVWRAIRDARTRE
jgi:hypothetical protein